MPNIDQLVKEARQEHLELLEMARSKAVDGVYREGTPEYDNLTEAYGALGIATSLGYAATVPIQSIMDDGDHC